MKFVVLFLISATLAYANPHIGREPILEELEGCGATTEMPAVAPGFSRPNEFRNCVHAKLLQERKNTLVSVGTLRTFFNLTMGNFSRAILLDCDPNITAFNRGNIKFISRLGQIGWSPYKQRLFYMATLFSVQFSEADVDRFVTANENSPTAAEKWANELLWKPIYSDSGPRAAPVERLEPFLSEFRATFKPAGWNMVMWKLTSLSHRMIYWLDNARWEKVQKLIETDHVIAVTGSLTGDRTMHSIARALQAQGPPESVSVLDISNSKDYFQPSTQETDSKTGNRFLANMAALPWDENAHVLYTYHGGVVRQPQESIPGCAAERDDWEYQTVEFGNLGALFSN